MINLEKMVDGLFKDINHIRSSPVSFAHNLAKKESLYMGDIYRPKGKYIQTKEGVNALRDAAVQLQRTRPLPPLIWSFALHVLADEQAIYIGTNGLNKGDRNLSQRAPRYAVISGRVNQLIELGGSTSEQVLHELIVDDGLATRKRRKTLLDQKYRYAGIASAKHSIYGYCTVIILAQQIHELLKPTRELVQLEVQKGLNKDISPGQNYYKIKKPPLLNQVKHFKKSQVIIPPPVMMQAMPAQSVAQNFPPNTIQTIQTSEIYDTTIVSTPPAVMTSSYRLPQMGLPFMPTIIPDQNVQVHLASQSSMQPGLIVTGPLDQQFVPNNQYRGTIITAPQHVMMVDRLSQYRPPQLPEEQPAPGVFQRCTQSCLLF